MARIALELTSQHWTTTGQDPPTRSTNAAAATIAGPDEGVHQIAERMVSLLLARIVALVSCRLGNGLGGKGKMYSDYSTTNLCRTALKRRGRDDAATSTAMFPSMITPRVISQLRRYVLVICQNYHSSTRVPYHNVEHAYHVFLSANKLLDLMLCEGKADDEDHFLEWEDGRYRRGERRWE